VHGSTTHELAHTAPCPVLALTRAMREHEPATDDDGHEHKVVAGV